MVQIFHVIYVSRVSWFFIISDICYRVNKRSQTSRSAVWVIDYSYDFMRSQAVHIYAVRTVTMTTALLVGQTPLRCGWTPITPESCHYPPVMTNERLPVACTLWVPNQVPSRGPWLFWANQSPFVGALCAK